MSRKFIVALGAFLSTFFVASVAFAQDGATGLVGGPAGVALLAAGFCMAIAAFGGALGQGRAAAAALEGISRNPGAAKPLFVPMILGLALIESLVIYALVVAILIWLKVA